MIAYEINPSSTRAVADKVLGIRPVAYNEVGNIKSGYKLPDELKDRHFVRQIGVVPKNGKAYAFIQPPGVYIPDFGYGPITGRIVVRETQVELEGNYDRFPALQRTKTFFKREISEDDMRPVKQHAFDVLNFHVLKRGQITEENMDELINDHDFCSALKAVFEAVGFETGFRVPPKEEREQTELAYSAIGSQEPMPAAYQSMDVAESSA